MKSFTAYLDTLEGPVKVKVLEVYPNGWTRVKVKARGGCFGAFHPYREGSEFDERLDELWKKCRPLGRFGTRHLFEGKFAAEDLK